MKVLLDTGILIDYLRGVIEEKTVINKFRRF